MNCGKIVGGDFLDPNNWTEDDHEHRIYGTDDLSVFVVVDAKYYSFLTQWKWTLHNRQRYEARGVIYLKRIVTEFTAPEGERYYHPITGKLVRNMHRVQRTRFIHQEIMELSGIEPPTPEHNEVDHISAKTWDCREDNLQWATRGMQVSGSNRGRKRVLREFGANVQESRPD